MHILKELIDMKTSWGVVIGLEEVKKRSLISQSNHKEKDSYANYLKECTLVSERNGGLHEALSSILA